MSRRHRRDRDYYPAAEIVRAALSEVERYTGRPYRRRRRRRGPSLFSKLLKAWLLMIAATGVIVPAMIWQGWLFGPRGIEGLVATPLLLVASWAAIFYFTVLRKAPPPPPVSAKANVALLPAQTDEWLETQRSLLPALAQERLDSISTRLETLAPQTKALNADTPVAAELRRLLGEELPELVRGYQKVPRALRTQPLHGGLTPESQLVEGLKTIDEHLARMHEQLAANDLHALATHQRYLELKYKRDDGKIE